MMSIDALYLDVSATHAFLFPTACVVPTNDCVAATGIRHCLMVVQFYARAAIFVALLAIAARQVLYHGLRV